MADERELGGAQGAEVGEIDLDLESEDLGSAAREAAAAPDDLRRENVELRERLLRALADFENQRKRTERERQEQRRYALFDAMRELVTVTDNLERAAEAGGSVEDLKAGVDLILKQMRELLRRHGVVAVEALGRPFDPAQHEAVTREEDAGVSSPTVTAELQRGYRMHDRLLRPAMVRVSVPSEPDEQDPRHRPRHDE
ncbi:MAG TPA: nucleotide exchange factor GrpE [Thermoanaerobaculia bacterium]|nr:nucleotide exchange factor GrpE [Thermoanaerobaculia bacterium]